MAAKYYHLVIKDGDNEIMSFLPCSEHTTEECKTNQRPGDHDDGIQVISSNPSLSHTPALVSTLRDYPGLVTLYPHISPNSEMCHSEILKVPFNSEDFCI